MQVLIHLWRMVAPTHSQGFRNPKSPGWDVVYRKEFAHNSARVVQKMLAISPGHVPVLFLHAPNLGGAGVLCFFSDLAYLAVGPEAAASRRDPFGDGLLYRTI